MGSKAVITDADKSAVGRIAGNGVSCYTAQAGGKRWLKRGSGKVAAGQKKKGVATLTIATP
jgi:hypothetical protein